jgi:hypothetical protein
MPHLVEGPEDILKNAREFKRVGEMRNKPAFENFGSFYHWYYIPNGDLLAPAKFLGYKDTTVEEYEGAGDGGVTRRHLEKWFTKVDRGKSCHDGLKAKLNGFANRIGKTINTRTFETDGAVYFPRKEYPELLNQLTPRAEDWEEPKGLGRALCNGYRILRDTATAREIKRLHSHRCQVCRCNPLRLADETPYAEAHHLKPLGSPHGGPDVPGNIICVCPNCHVLLDYFAIPLDLCKLGSELGHRVEQEYIQYHNEHHGEAKANISWPSP